MQSTLARFRLLALIEGVSLLVLVLIAMPMKYYLAQGWLVPWVGWTHGVLFLTYLVASLAVSHKLGWSIGLWLLSFLASVLPFGTFVLDLKLKRMQANA